MGKKSIKDQISIDKKHTWHAPFFLICVRLATVTGSAVCSAVSWTTLNPALHFSQDKSWAKEEYKSYNTLRKFVKFAALNWNKMEQRRVCQKNTRVQYFMNIWKIISILMTRLLKHCTIGMKMSILSSNISYLDLLWSNRIRYLTVFNSFTIMKSFDSLAGQISFKWNRMKWTSCENKCKKLLRKSCYLCIIQESVNIYNL